MSDLEYDILDELYFIMHFKELSNNVGLTDDEMKPVLNKLLTKGWIKCFEEPDLELNAQDIDLELNFRKYYYLATKTGLKAHTSS